MARLLEEVRGAGANQLGLWRAGRALQGDDCELGHL